MASFHIGTSIALENNKKAIIKGKIGEGGQGVVYLAEVDVLAVEVADALIMPAAGVVYDPGIIHASDHFAGLG